MMILMMVAMCSYAMNWDDYQPLDVLNEFIESLAASNPDFARIISIGQSYEGRDMKLLAVEKVSSTVQYSTVQYSTV